MRIYFCAAGCVAMWLLLGTAAINYREISEYRSGVLCSGREPPALGQLPVIDLADAAQRAAEPEWHEYIERVYNGGMPGVKYDLNTFNWFYWFAPLQREVRSLHLCAFNEKKPEIADGTPWGGSAHAWGYGPEHLMRRVGFFVHRRSHSNNANGHVQADVRKGWLEVQRTGPTSPWHDKPGGLEDGRAWHYHAVGSGIFLTTFPGKVETHYGMAISAPRCEIIVYGTNRGQFWPKNLVYKLGNGERCDDNSARWKQLHCANRPVPIWDGNEKPPGQCSGWRSP